jgi:hypothetical protein
VEVRLAHRAVSAAERPEALVPRVRPGHAYHLGEVLPRHRGRGARRGERRRLVDTRGIACRCGDDAAVLRALGAQQPREAPGIDVADGHDPGALEVGGQVLGVAPVRSGERQVADHEARGVGLERLGVLGIGAGVADVGVGEGDDLARVRGIGEDLLVAGHRGVEHHFAHRLPACTDRAPTKNAPVGKDQDGGRFLRHR